MDGVLKYLYNNLFQCKLCGGRFSSEAHLTEHEQKVHGGACSRIENVKRDNKNQDKDIRTFSSKERIIQGQCDNIVDTESIGQRCSSDFRIKADNKHLQTEHKVGGEEFSNWSNEQKGDKFQAHENNTHSQKEKLTSDCAENNVVNEYFKSKHVHHNLFHCKEYDARYPSKAHLVELGLQVHDDACFEGQHEEEKSVNLEEKMKTNGNMEKTITATIGDGDNNYFSLKCLYNNLFQCNVCSARFSSKAHLTEHEYNVHSDRCLEAEDKTAEENMNALIDRERTISDNHVHVPNADSSYNGYNLMFGGDHIDIGCNVLDGTDNEILRQRMEQFNAYLKLVRDRMNEMPDNLQGVKVKAEGIKKNENKMTLKSSGPHHIDTVTDSAPATYKVDTQTSEKISSTSSSEGKDTRESSAINDSVSQSKTTLEKKFKCDRCGSAFAHNHKLIRHYRIHTGEKPYKCELCGAAFSQKSILNNHVTLHTGEKPFKCEICNASFSLKDYLIKHHRTHTGEKPFQCDMCDSVFSDRGNLSKHRKIHFGEKPYKCSVCGAAFSDRSTLTKHSRIHTDGKKYKCEFCNASFSMKSALTTHKKMHLDDVQHKCDVCQAEFSQRGYLIRHLRTHTGEKQYIPSLLVDKKNDESLMNEEQ